MRFLMKSWDELKLLLNFCVNNNTIALFKILETWKKLCYLIE